MSRLLSVWWLTATLLICPRMAHGQRTNPDIPPTSIPGTAPFEPDNRLEILSRTRASISVRELSIPQRVRNAYNKGVDRLTKKDPAGSLVHFQRAADAFPNFYEAYYAMGLAQMILSRAEDAEQAFQKSIDVSGGHYAVPHFGLSVLLCNQRKFAEAEPIIRKALELEPGFGPGYFTLSWALFGLNRLDEAEKNARETALREPKLGLARLLLANIYIHRRDYLAASGEPGLISNSSPMAL